MRVVLYAPTIAQDWGGVWQFTQLVLRELKTVAHYHLVGSRELVDELVAMELSPSPSETICFDDFSEKLGAGTGSSPSSIAYSSLAHRLMEQKIDLVHVPIQLLCDLPVARGFPYILNPHDYQHEYFPDFFSQNDIDGRRRVWYPTQRNAAALVVHSRQTQQDALRFLGIPEERVFYAHYGPLKSFDFVDQETVDRTVEKFSLPDRYLFYPARMWPHKNHVTLIKALAILKRQGTAVHCLFTDDQAAHAELVRQAAEDEGITDLIMTVGRVSPAEMSALYQRSLMVVVPSLFEQNSGPMLEAIHFEKPVAVSNLPELTDSLNGHGFTFDARSAHEIAATLEPFLNSRSRQQSAIEDIRALKSAMTWEPFRNAYRCAYEYALGR